ncbi:hypothetical protein XOCgx_2303 [Xanthomonas oryzae pv. oryzicola]|nr:hypothetical protein XOCgx_2303 [Xanthomonas oryzae pv. oryzicola]
MALPQNSLPLSVRITCGRPRLVCQPIQHACHPVAGDGAFDLDGDCLVCRVVHDHQTLDH